MGVALTLSPLVVTMYAIAERFIGMKEVPGSGDNPAVLAMLKLDESWPEHDEVPWCSAFMNYCAWLLRLPRSKSLLARSWLAVGTPVELYSAVQGFDIVILNRGGTHNVNNHTDPGHVALFSSKVGSDVYVLGGNQSNTVSISAYNDLSVLGVRRLR